ncbi:hypothetical protein REJC140_03695 [Pseudorhizobium endolithicum]|uniref:Uncharacterized protein n=1 Tax=Pseudorhizobium endolithicum TaxID=1191678 RepID=A0ABM8PMB5_9HYPH|nr:hypothetical protein REJC140_03695 [Pseudorhizobium endolithicum]
MAFFLEARDCGRAKEFTARVGQVQLDEKTEVQRRYP